MNPIVIKNLVKRFGPVTALSDLSLEIEAHEIFALLGPDGSGKTTTSRILAAVMDPTAGEVKVASFDVRRESEKIKEKIGYMPQAFGLYPDLSIEENINFYADIYGISRRARLSRMNRLLEFTGLAPFVKRLAGRLSGGMKQKLALTCSLIHTPEILILDEPTLGVDPVSRREFWKLLYELLKDGATILVTTSYMDEAQRCNRAGLLHRGRLIACDKPESIRDHVKGLMTEIACERQMEALRLLESLPQVRLVTAFGEKIHFLADSGEQQALILSELRQNKFCVSQAKEVRASLEDAFIFLIKRSEASDGGA